MNEEKNVVRQGWSDLFEHNLSDIPTEEVSPKVTWTNWDETPPLEHPAPKATTSASAGVPDMGVPTSGSHMVCQPAIGT